MELGHNTMHRGEKEKEQRWMMDGGAEGGKKLSMGRKVQFLKDQPVLVKSTLD